jgi:membrane-bound ClpP family serine protease
MDSEIENKKSNTISVSITPEMKEYLNNHPSLKQSAIFQEAMERIMNPRKNPLLLLIGFLGICFSIICITAAVSGIFLMFEQEGIILSAVFFCVGCASLTTTVVTFYKNRR